MREELFDCFEKKLVNDIWNVEHKHVFKVHVEKEFSIQEIGVRYWTDLSEKTHDSAWKFYTLVGYFPVVCLKCILRNNPIETLTYLSTTAMRLKLLSPSGCGTVAHL